MTNEPKDESIIHQKNMYMYDDRVGFGRRLGAYLLDIFLIITLGILLSLFTGEFFVNLFFRDQLVAIETTSALFDGMNFDYMLFMTRVYQISAACSLITILLFVMEGIKGQSIGKMILKIQNTNTDGSEANSIKKWLRALLKYGSTILSVFAGLISFPFIGTLGSVWSFVIFIGFFFVFGDKKQAIHDMIAKTIVSRK
jgi:uncharacterized RDD family membrane protein YckC